MLACFLLFFSFACADDPGADVDEAPTEITGVIVSIEPAEGDIESFVLEEDDGDAHEVLIAEDVDYGFDLQHLHDHHETEDPVVVTTESRDGALVATSIEDV